MSTDVRKRDLVIRRVFEAPLQQVWQAWTDPEQLKQWWGPQGFDCPVAELDVRAGSTSLVAMRSPEHGEHYSIWQYTSIVPMESIEYIHNLADKDGNKVDPVQMGMPPEFPQDQRHSLSFKPLEDGRTELTVTEYGWIEGDMMNLSEMGMNQCLDKMASLLAGKDTRDQSK